MSVIPRDPASDLESSDSPVRERWTSLAEWARTAPVDADVVGVRNLSTTKIIIPNAWGLSKSQPVLISAKVYLFTNFENCAESDSLGPETVHYGNLSKSLLSIEEQNRFTGLGSPKPWTLATYVSKIRSTIRWMLSDARNLQALELDIVLPKASLLGAGIGLKDCTLYRIDPDGDLAENVRATAITINQLHIPTLVGINDYERGAKQMVVVDAELEPFTYLPDQAACEVEQIIVKTVEEATSETLEHLILLVATRVIKYWLFRHKPVGQIRLRIEKPIAVVVAAGVGVSIVRKADITQPFGKNLWEECGCQTPPKIPFPLKGRLDEFLSSLPVVAK